MTTICRASITTRDGRMLLAKDFGLKAFCFDVDLVNRKTDKKADEQKSEEEQLN